MNTAILLISCPDKKGITAAITNFVYKNNGNIVHADQHIDDQSNTFFMRIEWQLRNFRIARQNLRGSFSPFAKKFKMHWSLHFKPDTPKVAIFVSKTTHCLYDLLLKQKQGDLGCVVPLIISNHKAAGDIARTFGIDFYHFSKNERNKIEIEKKETILLRKHNVDLIILARYMQIFSKNFINKFPSQIINIHHSFLPAFAGSNPYAKAYQRGVKIIGATSHYVTKDLDNGPIIEQDITRITHRSSLENLKREGQELERVVLNRAVRRHLERKILVYNNKTVIFD